MESCLERCGLHGYRLRKKERTCAHSKNKTTTQANKSEKFEEAVRPVRHRENIIVELSSSALTNPLEF